MEPGIDLLIRTDATDLRDGAIHCRLQLPRGLTAVKAGDGVDPDVQFRRAPPAVASRRPEAGDLSLEDGDAQRRIFLEQVVSGPQSRITGSEDRDIDIDRSVERGTWRQRITRRLEPVAVGGIVPQATVPLLVTPAWRSRMVSQGPGVPIEDPQPAPAEDGA